MSGSYKKAVINNIKLDSFDEQSETLNFSVDATVCYESFYYVPIKVGKVQTMQKMYNYHYFTKTLDVSTRMNKEYQSNPLKAVRDYLDVIKQDREHSFEVSESYKKSYMSASSSKDFILDVEDIQDQGVTR